MHDMSWFSKAGLVHRLIWKHLSKTISYAGGKFVDLGCGDRPYESMYKPHVDKYIGLDYLAPYLERRRCDVIGDVMFLPYKSESVDTVLSNQVIEHVREPWTMVEEISRILKPNGTIILTAPHIWGLHDEPHDYYRYTCYGLKYLLERAGLEVLYFHAMAGFWVTAGVRFCYYITRIIPRFLLPPFYAIIQIGAYLLDHLHFVEGDTWNYIAVAKKTSGSVPK